MTTPMPELPIAGYLFSRPGISKIDVWPHGGGWEKLCKVSDAIAAIEAATLAAQRRPLTDAHLFALLVNIDPETKRLLIGLKLFAREIETAHGITATPQGKI